MSSLREEEYIWLGLKKLKGEKDEPYFLGYVFHVLEPALHSKGNFNTHGYIVCLAHMYIDLITQFITFENIFINTTLILLYILYILYDVVLYGFQISFISHSKSADATEFLSAP